MAMLVREIMTDQVITVRRTDPVRHAVGERDLYTKIDPVEVSGRRLRHRP